MNGTERNRLGLLYIETPAGDYFPRLAERAIAACKQRGCMAYFEFNGVTITVDANSTPDDAQKIYLDELKREQEKWKSSPEGIAYKAEQERKERERAIKDSTVNKKIANIHMEFADESGWNTFVKNNQVGYGAAIIRFAERWAKLMQAEMNDGKQLEEVADSTFRDADDERIAGFIYGAAVATLSETWKHGELLRRWHNKDVQIGNEGDIANAAGGVLNPAILNIGGTPTKQLTNG